MEYRRVRYSYPGPGESSLEVSCVEQASGASCSAMLRTMATLFGTYFVVLFSFILLRSSMRAGGTPGVRAAA